MKSAETFDFDEWKSLAARDPQAFAERREEFIAAQIGRFPAGRRERLTRFQWRLDAERQRSSNPLGACLKFSEQMWDAFYRMDGQLQQLLKSPIRDGNQPRCGVVSFPGRPVDDRSDCRHDKTR